METIRDLFRYKGHQPVHSVRPQDTVAKALEMMSNFDIGAILVIEHDEIVGIFSERDNARKTAIRNHAPESTLVSEVMVDQVVYVSPDYKLEECLALMNSKNIRHLPVIENNKVIALIGIQEVSCNLIEDKEFMIGELTKYITGSFIYEKEKSKHETKLVIQKTPGKENAHNHTPNNTVKINPPGNDDK